MSRWHGAIRLLSPPGTHQVLQLGQRALHDFFLGGAEIGRVLVVHLFGHFQNLDGLLGILLVVQERVAHDHERLDLPRAEELDLARASFLKLADDQAVFGTLDAQAVDHAGRIPRICQHFSCQIFDPVFLVLPDQPEQRFVNARDVVVASHLHLDRARLDHGRRGGHPVDCVLDHIDRLHVFRLGRLVLANGVGGQRASF